VTASPAASGPMTLCDLFAKTLSFYFISMVLLCDNPYALFEYPGIFICFPLLIFMLAFKDFSEDIEKTK
jgi:hypothetical protein